MEKLRQNETVKDGTKIVVYSAYANVLERLGAFTINLFLYLIPVVNLFFIYKNIKSMTTDGSTYGHRLTKTVVVSSVTGGAIRARNMLDRLVIWIVTVSLTVGSVYYIFVASQQDMYGNTEIILFAVMSLTAIFGIIIYISKKNQLLHDKIMKTIVVRTDDGRSRLFVNICLAFGYLLLAAGLFAISTTNVFDKISMPNFSNNENLEQYADASNRVEQADIIMSLLQDPGSGEYLASRDLPVEEMQIIIGDVPEGLQWLDNRKNPLDYCIYVRSDNGYVFSSNSGIGQRDSQPQDLSDCN